MYIIHIIGRVSSSYIPAIEEKRKVSDNLFDIPLTCIHNNANIIHAES